MHRSIISFFLGLAEVSQSLVGLFAGIVSVAIIETLQNLLERIESLLPSAIALDPDLDTAEDHLLSATEIYS